MHTSWKLVGHENVLQIIEAFSLVRPYLPTSHLHSAYISSFQRQQFSPLPEGISFRHAISPAIRLVSEISRKSKNWCISFRPPGCTSICLALLVSASCLCVWACNFSGNLFLTSNHSQSACISLSLSYTHIHTCLHARKAKLKQITRWDD